MQVRTYLIDLAAAAGPLEHAEARLGLLGSDGQLQGDRRLARIAVRLALREDVGDEPARRALMIAPGGKPSLPGAGVHFSVSHSAGMALLGLARAAPIGVDIEAVRHVSITQARRASILAAGGRLSIAPLEAARDDDRFVDAWTRIEAVAKAGGVGALSMLAWLGGRAADDPQVQRYVLASPGRLELDAMPYVVSPLTVPPGFRASICHPRTHAIAAPAGHDALLSGVLG